MEKSFSFFLPVRIVFGAGKLTEVGIHAKNYGKKALIVTTGTFFKESGLVGRVEKSLQDAGVSSVYFSEVDPNPLSTQVDKGAEIVKQNGCDLVIGLGGGSAIDAAKSVAIASGHNAPIWNFAAGCNPNAVAITSKTLPIIAITTTSGTGSHVTPWSVITNPTTKEKPGLGSDYMFAKVAIVDPELMLSVPSKITSATGFDVLAHSIEAYNAKVANPMTDLYCEEAIRLVGKYLRKAVKDGKDLEARTAMALADTYAGITIAISSTTLCHCMAHSVGGVAGTTHGETLAAMTPHTMRFSMNNSPEKYKQVGILLRNECCCEEDSDEACLLEDSVKEVEKLIKDIGLDAPLSKQGVKESDLEEIADGTLGYMGGGVKLEPKVANRTDVLNILRKSL